MNSEVSLIPGCGRKHGRGRKHGALRPQKPLRLIRDGKVGGRELLYLTPTRYTVTTKNDSVGSCVSHFNVSLFVWAKPQDSVHKPHFLKRTESRSGSNRGRSAFKPSALPLGHTGSPRGENKERNFTVCTDLHLFPPPQHKLNELFY